LPDISVFVPAELFLISCPVISKDQKADKCHPDQKDVPIVFKKIGQEPENIIPDTSSEKAEDVRGSSFMSELKIDKVGTISKKSNAIDHNKEPFKCRLPISVLSRFYRKQKKKDKKKIQDNYGRSIKINSLEENGNKF
jgi:hypothetical protein